MRNLIWKHPVLHRAHVSSSDHDLAQKERLLYALLMIAGSQSVSRHWRLMIQHNKGISHHSAKRKFASWWAFISCMLLRNIRLYLKDKEHDINLLKYTAFDKTWEL